MSWVATIALLCQIPANNSVNTIEREQLKCQKSLITCIQSKSHATRDIDNIVAGCVLERSL